METMTGLPDLTSMSLRRESINVHPLFWKPRADAEDEPLVWRFPGRKDEFMQRWSINQHNLAISALIVFMEYIATSDDYTLEQKRTLISRLEDTSIHTPGTTLNHLLSNETRRSLRVF